MKPGDPCQAYYKSKWQLATVVSVGRKWAVVKINGRNQNSHLPVAAIREVRLPVVGAVDAAPVMESETDSYHLDDSDESYIKLRERKRIIAVIPRACAAEAEIMLSALLEAHEALVAVVTAPTAVKTEKEEKLGKL